MKVGFRYTEEKKMITIARCLSEDYIHSSKLKNFCSSHGMTVSENKPELLRQIIEFAGEDESSSIKNIVCFFNYGFRRGSRK